MKARALGAFVVIVAAACGGGDEQGTRITVTTGGTAGTAGSTGGAPNGGASSGKGGASAGKAGAGVAGAAAGKAGASGGGAAGKAGGSGGASGSSAGKAGSGGAPVPCTTRITYGDRWIHPNHPSSFDDADGAITWDGACVPDGANAYAVLSNGWKPYFEGHGGCVMALEQSNGCPGAASAACSTRVGYGPAWLPASNHPDAFDDVAGKVWSSDACQAAGGNVHETLSNGWGPTFSGECQVALSFRQCGGLFDNPVIGEDCPDPGVMRSGNQYFLSCTGGDGGGLYVIRSSTDLTSWKKVGHVFPNGTAPAWSKGSYWAPELHEVGGHFVAYFSAQHADGSLCVGAATSNKPEGPYTDVGKPLVHDPSMGMIDAHQVTDAGGTPYLVWKADGNAQGKPTPIYGQQLSADGTSLVGTRKTLITNDLAWEGPLVEGPFVVRRGGEYFLFYSANAYYNDKYAVGVAKASSPLGPYVKHGAPILTSNGAWTGPGHCSVVSTPTGDAMVYHAWRKGLEGKAPGRLTLVDAVTWEGGWPRVFGAPSFHSRPIP